MFVPYLRPYSNVNSQLLTSLQEGGYILYARHAEATVGMDDPNLSFENCATQRNLSAVGRRQAETYGRTLRNFEIPTAYPVLASPFCRTIETAELAFGRDNVQVDPFWIEIYKLSGRLSVIEQSWILYDLNTFLEIQPPQGSNKVIIAHSFPSGIGLGQIPNMGTVVIRPHGQGRGYEVVAHLTLSELGSLQE
ncbi:histidine phosphatase family protein [Anaerobacillus alkalidiazotrophicus]|uniref:Histidine phosphatase family protein n=1 Tax=Anaerobacillus alkalidiazotrophicus TaxID=472963 RepID=A0A1S2M2U9_9BACI|nr:histidine phosphatase family protein [Anaerobacillus alkalidiazotrophicus]